MKSYHLFHHYLNKKQLLDEIRGLLLAITIETPNEASDINLEFKTNTLGNTTFIELEYEVPKEKKVPYILNPKHEMVLNVLNEFDSDLPKYWDPNLNHSGYDEEYLIERLDKVADLVIDYVKKLTPS